MRAVEQELAGGSDFDSAGGAMQQLHAELGLQRPDLARQRRLGDVQPVGGTPEMTLLGDGHEIAQVTQFHQTRRLLPTVGVSIKAVLVLRTSDIGHNVRRAPPRSVHGQERSRS